MELHPCAQCRRHVGIDERACPFCGSQLPAALPRPRLAGRLSRAAVFAGATLASACYTSSPPPHQGPPPPPPPPDDTRVQHPNEPPPPPPPDDTQAQTFAKPPVAVATLRGRVTDEFGNPLPNIRVLAVNSGVSTNQTRTDPGGHYVFVDVPAGKYRVVFEGPARSPRQAVSIEQRVITLAAGGMQTLDMALVTSQPADVDPVDRSACCKPYGAPPARRRVV